MGEWSNSPWFLSQGRELTPSKVCKRGHVTYAPMSAKTLSGLSRGGVCAHASPGPLAEARNLQHGANVNRDARDGHRAACSFFAADIVRAKEANLLFTADLVQNNVLRALDGINCLFCVDAEKRVHGINYLHNHTLTSMHDWRYLCYCTIRDLCCSRTIF